MDFTAVYAHSPVRAVPLRLAQELVDMTIDYLHDDRDALMQCSLVCRDWVHSSSLHLFNRMRWPPCPKKQKACLGALDGDDCFSSCLDLLSASRRLRSTVRVLQLSCHKCAIQRDTSRRSAPLPFSVLFSIIESLPVLRTLELHECRLLPETPPADFYPTRSLDKIKITYIWRQAGWQATLDFLSLFRRVGSLHIHSLLSSGSRASSPSLYFEPSGPVLEIDSLTIRGVGETYVLNRLSAIAKFSALKHLNLQCHVSSDLREPIQSMTNIRSISYDVEGSYPPIALREATLHAIHLSGYFRVSRSVPSSEWDTITRDLDILVTRELQELRVVMHLEGDKTIHETKDDELHCLEQSLMDLNWSTIAAVVSRSCSLRLLTLDLRNHVHPKRMSDKYVVAAREIATKRLPAPLARVLRVVSIS